MIIIILVCIIFFIISYNRITKRLRVLNSMCHAEKLGVNFCYGKYYYIMVDNMQYLEIENFIKFEKKVGKDNLIGIIINTEEYYNAELYQPNFIIELEIKKVPLIIFTLNNKFILLNTQGKEEREVDLNALCN